MKKHLFSAVSLAAMLAGTAAPALAQETAVRVEASAAVQAGLLKERREERREEVKEDRQENREEAKEHREEFRAGMASKSAEFRADMKERLSELRMRRIKAWWDRAARRLHNVIERQRKLAVRIEARIDRLEKAGHDVTDSRAALVAARVKIDVAAQSLTDASAKVEVITHENEPKEAFRKLHELHKGIVANIRAAHHALVRVLVSLRADVKVDANVKVGNER